MSGASVDTLAVVHSYHQRTKHHPRRYARSLGYLDWSSQPNPFRIYEPTRCYPLDDIEPTPEPSLDDAFVAGGVPPRALDRSAVSQLFYDSLAISAWKELQGSTWSLRVNPSSGNLHPTEGYLITGPVPGLLERPAICHYSPYLHVLEERTALEHSEWVALSEGLPGGSVLVGLTSIYWRESWKYGERAFRYCQHDVGHALGALAMAAGALGWKARLLEGVTDDELAVLLRIDRQEGPEAEHPDGLVVLYPAGEALAREKQRSWRVPQALRERLASSEAEGRPNHLSTDHHPWPVIDAVSEATCRHSLPARAFLHTGSYPAPPPTIHGHPVPAREIIRKRRSAVAMDGQTWLEKDVFYGILERLSAREEQPPQALFPWRPGIHPVLFVHRVRGLEPGLYILVRDPAARRRLEKAMRPEFSWSRVPACPERLDLFLLLADDTREAAQGIACQQEIASDGAFAVGMIAEYESPLESFGPWFYRRLHWEAGALGQVLYLEAEAAGLRGTGIGCYFDDLMHHLLGLSGRKFQSLYHFTVGGALEDSRLRTLAPYHHRQSVE